MRAWIIVINWCLSFFGLGLESTNGSVVPTIVGLAWFGLSTLIMVRADKKGQLKRIEKRFKIDEL